MGPATPGPRSHSRLRVRSWPGNLPIAALYVGRALRYHQSWEEAAGQEMAQLWTCSGLNCLFDGGFYLDGLQAGSIPAAAQRLDQANGGHQALAQNLGRQALCIQQRLL